MQGNVPSDVSIGVKFNKLNMIISATRGKTTVIGNYSKADNLVTGIWDQIKRLDEVDIPDEIDMSDAEEFVPYAGYQDWVPSDTQWGFDAVSYTPPRVNKPTATTNDYKKARLERLKATLDELVKAREEEGAKMLFPPEKSDKEKKLEKEIKELEKEIS